MLTVFLLRRKSEVHLSTVPKRSQLFEFWSCSSEHVRHVWTWRAVRASSSVLWWATPGGSPGVYTLYTGSPRLAHCDAKYNNWVTVAVATDKIMKFVTFLLKIQNRTVPYSKNYTVCCRIWNSSKAAHPRSVLEALLKKGSRVVLTCSNQALAHAEQRRLR